MKHKLLVLIALRLSLLLTRAVHCSAECEFPQNGQRVLLLDGRVVLLLLLVAEFTNVLLNLREPELNEEFMLCGVSM